MTKVQAELTAFLLDCKKLCQDTPFQGETCALSITTYTKHTKRGSGGDTKCRYSCEVGLQYTAGELVIRR